MQRTYYFVTVTKARTGETFSGVMADDGLQSLWTVYTEEDGERYASVLDSVHRDFEIDRDQYDVCCSEASAA